MSYFINDLKTKYLISKKNDVDKTLLKQAYVDYLENKKNINFDEAVFSFNKTIEDLSPELVSSADKIVELLEQLKNSKYNHQEISKEFQSNFLKFGDAHGFLKTGIRFDLLNGELIALFNFNKLIYAFNWKDKSLIGALFNGYSNIFEREGVYNKSYQYSLKNSLCFDRERNSKIVNQRYLTTFYGSYNTYNGYTKETIHNMNNFTLDVGKSMDRIQLVATEDQNVFILNYCKIIRTRNKEGYYDYIIDNQRPILSTMVSVNPYIMPTILNDQVFIGHLINLKNENGEVISLNELCDNPEYLDLMKRVLFHYGKHIKNNIITFQNNLDFDKSSSFSYPKYLDDKTIEK